MNTRHYAATKCESEVGGTHQDVVWCQAALCKRKINLLSDVGYQMLLEFWAAHTEPAVALGIRWLAIHVPHPSPRVARTTPHLLPTSAVTRLVARRARTILPSPLPVPTWLLLPEKETLLRPSVWPAARNERVWGGPRD